MTKHHTYVAIMAGGIGSRFWPASRSARPKQFLDILGTGKTLLRSTYERFLRLCPSDNIFIVTNEQYTGLVKEQLPELTDNQILAEPSRNNTAPCITYTALKLQQLDPNANMVVAPSDHIILDETQFIADLEECLAFTASNHALLTLGIQPSRPDTGYGYIHFDKNSAGSNIRKVLRFTEKPPLDQAQAFLASGDYLWNAGIFIWKAQSALEALAIHSPDTYQILAAGADCYNTPEEAAFIRRAYPTTPNISIDYALMEKADNVYTLPAHFGWSDLGTWASLHAESEKDESGNSINAGPCQLEQVSNCLLRLPKDKLLVAKGLEDFIIVDEGDVLLIWPKSEEQAIKQVLGRIGDEAFL
ncbi:MAG TPA: mannose-1-phosphate guanylyltransferase [Saprospiraceae bacterium]|nr:mannose-1-phosphate guanylyltransferase [Saprospiraceae bacterium]HMQ81457.1 mannose-1-phosphate guanylyltransferase [Saprospiraceae bacterium]